MTKPKIGSVANWFGTNRTGAELAGKLVAGRSWVGVPMCGGCSELPYFTDANIIMAGDRHRHLINLCEVIGNDAYLKELKSRLEKVPFHPDVLSQAHQYCKAREAKPGMFDIADKHSEFESVVWAAQYFICNWMGRASEGGTKSEFKGAPSFRWKSGGGDSVIRFRNSIDSLEDWGKVFSRVTFNVLDVFEFLDECLKKGRDIDKNAIYIDPTFPGYGDNYKYCLTGDDHVKLAKVLSQFKNTRIVVRFYDEPIVRELYSPIELMEYQTHQILTTGFNTDGKWICVPFESRNQKRDSREEIYLVRN